jgi:hypothetical protein
VQRQQDGGSTQVRFWVDGVEASAFFAVVSDDEGFTAGAATLALGDEEFDLEREGESLDALDGLEFSCLPTLPNGWQPASP